MTVNHNLTIQEYSPHRLSLHIQQIWGATLAFIWSRVSDECKSNSHSFHVKFFILFISYGCCQPTVHYLLSGLEYCKVLTNIKVPVTRYILLLLELLSTKKIPKVPKCVINVDYLEGGHNQWKEPFYFTGNRGHILGVWFLKVIFQCYEHHKWNSIHFHCTGETAESNTFKNKTNNLDKLKTQFFAGLNATTFRKCFGWIKYLGTYCIL